jgi:hypothetical protein
MMTYGPHLYRSARPCDFQHQGSRAIFGCVAKATPVSLHGWNCSRTRCGSAIAQRPNRSRSHSTAVSGENWIVRNRRQGEVEFERLGSPRISRQTELHVANRLCRVQCESFPKTIGFELHCQPGRASSKDFVSGRIHRVPQKSRNRIRGKIFMGMRTRIGKCFLPRLPGLDLFRSFVL